MTDVGACTSIPLGQRLGPLVEGFADGTGRRRGWQLGDCGRGEAQTLGRGDQGPQVGLGYRGGTRLGQHGLQRVVETQAGDDGGAPLVWRAITMAEGPLGTLDEIAAGRYEGVVKVVGHDGDRAAWPYERPDHQADPTADGDVLHPDHPDPPTDGHKQVVKHDQQDGKGRLSHRKGRHSGSVGGQEHRDGQDCPQHGVVGAHGQQHGRPDEEADRRAPHRAERRPSGRGCGGA